MKKRSSASAVVFLVEEVASPEPREVVREHDDVALPPIDVGRARLTDVEGDEVARGPHRRHVAVGALRMGLALEAGVATAILEAVDAHARRAAPSFAYPPVGHRRLGQ